MLLKIDVPFFKLKTCFSHTVKFILFIHLYECIKVCMSSESKILMFSHINQVQRRIVFLFYIQQKVKILPYQVIFIQQYTFFLYIVCT